MSCAAAAMAATLVSNGPTQAATVSIAQHDTKARSGSVYGRDVEPFGVTDKIDYDGQVDHDLKFDGSKSRPDVHKLKIGDRIRFVSRMEFGAFTNIANPDGRALFVPTGEGELSPYGGDLGTLTPDLRNMTLKNYASLFGQGLAAGVFDYTTPWKIEVTDGIQTVTETVSSTLSGTYGVGGAYSVETTTIKTSPTKVTRAQGGADEFDFELTKPQGTGDWTMDAKQGFFADGGTLTVTGFIRAVRVGTGVVWFDNYTVMSFDGIFEGDDPDLVHSGDEASLGTDIGDLLLRQQVRTVPWDRYLVVETIPLPPAFASLLVALFALFGVTSRRRRAGT